MLPIDIVCGLSGAGKTTWINRLLEETADGSRSLIVQNESGEVCIDPSLLKENDRLTEISGGCLCCSSDAAFIDILHREIVICRPERILIEASGSAQPEKAAQACLRAAGSTDAYIRSLITVVSAETFCFFSESGGSLFKKQLSEPDCIVMSGVSLIDSGERGTIETQLKQLNVTAPVSWTAFEPGEASQVFSAAAAERSRRKPVQTVAPSFTEKYRIKRPGSS